MPSGVSKASGLHDLCALMSKSMKNTVVIGDYYNDLEIMREAGYAVAVANAPAEVKAAAHYIKGAAANMCAAELRDVAYDIEMAAQDGNIELADRLVRQLDTRWQDFLRHPKVREGLTAG